MFLTSSEYLKDYMFKNYLSEIVLSVAVVFMAVTLSLTGVLAFALALAFLGGLKWLDYMTLQESPDLIRLKEEISELKTKVDKLILGRGR